MGKIVVEGTDEELKQVKGPPGVRVSAFDEPAKTIKGGNKEMPEEHKATDWCPTCSNQGQRLERRMENQERDHKTELEKASAEAEQMREQLAEAMKPKPQDIPDFKDILAHCESGQCPSHAQQLQDYREKVAGDVVGNLIKPENKSRLVDIIEAAGLELAPNKIIITRG